MMTGPKWKQVDPHLFQLHAGFLLLTLSRDSDGWAFNIVAHDPNVMVTGASLETAKQVALIRAEAVLKDALGAVVALQGGSVKKGEPW